MYQSVVARGLCKGLTVLCFLFLFAIQNASAGQVTLGWDKSTDSTVTGYKVYHGTKSRNYTDSADVGTALTHIFSGLSDTQPHYFAVTAHSSTAESGFSNELVCYPIQVSASTNGQIQPGNVILAQGSSQTFNIVPAAGYAIANVIVDGVSKGAVSQYTFSSLSACHTISASFTAGGSYSITASTTGNGAITPSGTINVAAGANKTVTITPNANYHVSDVKVDGTSVGAVTSYTFSNVTANHTIVASFAQNTSVTITPTAGANGSISPSGAVTVSYGSSQTFTMTPTKNYHVSDVKVDGTSVGAITSYTFSDVTANHTITASFALNTFTITPTAGANGSISPAGAVTVSYGSSQTFTFTPSKNYRVADVKIDGTSAGALTSYTFSNVTANHTIAAGFIPSGRPPLVDAGPNQVATRGATVTLNGANSRDQDGYISMYQWSQTGGTPVSLRNPNAAQTTFTAPIVGPEGSALTFKLTVKDNAGYQATDTCIVNVVNVNQPPVAKVGPDQTVSSWTIVTLDGSKSTDSEGAGLSYLWEQIAGTVVALSAPQSAQPTLVAPEVGSGSTSLVFRLTVTDAYGLKSTETSIVNVTGGNTAPQALTASSQTVSAGALVRLDGSGSKDLDDGIASFWWHQVCGPPVTLSDPRVAKPTFTAPRSGSNSPLIFQLTVTDAGGLKSRSAQSITLR